LNKFNKNILNKILCGIGFASILTVSSIILNFKDSVLISQRSILLEKQLKINNINTKNFYNFNSNLAQTQLGIEKLFNDLENEYSDENQNDNSNLVKNSNNFNVMEISNYFSKLLTINTTMSKYFKNENQDSYSQSDYLSLNTTPTVKLGFNPILIQAFYEQSQIAQEIYDLFALNSTNTGANGASWIKSEFKPQLANFLNDILENKISIQQMQSYLQVVKDHNKVGNIDSWNWLPYSSSTSDKAKFYTMAQEFGVTLPSFSGTLNSSSNGTDFMNAFNKIFTNIKNFKWMIYQAFSNDIYADVIFQNGDKETKKVYDGNSHQFLDISKAGAPLGLDGTIIW